MSAPSSASGSARFSTRQTLAILLAATLAARLALAAVTPLVDDEVYYRLWSLKPAFGYYDHPPMVAWWMWLGRQIAGDNAFGLRLLPALAATATSLVTFDVARLLGLGDRVALRAVLWLNATILVGVAGFLSVPDPPNTLFWMLSLWGVLRGLSGRGAWWLLAGLMAGLACLAKYSALFLAPGVVLWLVLSAEGRRALRTPWPWLAAAIAALVFAPNVVWNAEHGWPTFHRQFGRLFFAALQPAWFGKFVLDQFLLLNPLIAVFLARAVRRRTAWPLLAVCAPFAAYLVFHSLHDEVQGQWPAPLYPGLAICAAAAAEGVTGWLARLRTVTPWLGYGACAAAFAWILAPLPPLPFRDPVQPLRGWPAFYAAVEADRVATGAAWVGATDYSLAAMFTVSPDTHVPSPEIVERNRATFETPSQRADFSRPGLVLENRKKPPVADLARCFASVQPLPAIPRGGDAHPALYAIYRVAGPLVDVERDGCPLAKR